MERKSLIVLWITVAGILIAGLVEAGEARLPVGSSVYANGTWKNVSDLKSGDLLQTAEGRMVRITDISEVPSNQRAPCYGFSMNQDRGGYVLGSGIIVADGKSIGTATTTQPCGWECRFLQFLGLSNKEPVGMNVTARFINPLGLHILR